MANWALCGTAAEYGSGTLSLKPRSKIDRYDILRAMWLAFDCCSFR